MTRVHHADLDHVHAEHAGATEHAWGASELGSVVLDIGGFDGALIVRTPGSLCGSEIEIRVPGAAWTGLHTAVRERLGAAEPVFAGVFPRLDAGTYEIRVRGTEAPGQRVRVEGATANEVWLETPPASGRNDP